MTDKLILTDCDGVIINWVDGFDKWMNTQGYYMKPGTEAEYSMAVTYGITKDQAYEAVHEFNNSPAIAELGALRDAIEYVQRLNKVHGYKFHAITSLSDNPMAKKYRTQNLISLFGEGVFTEVTCLAMGARKTHVLSQYKDSGLFWLEDHPDNADDGHALGLRSVLVEHEHNADHECPYPVVERWEEIYSLIVNQTSP